MLRLRCVSGDAAWRGLQLEQLRGWVDRGWRRNGALVGLQRHGRSPPRACVSRRAAVTESPCPSRWATGLLVGMSLALAGCHQVWEYKYISLESTPGAVVVKRAPVALDKAFFLPTIPVEYQIVRSEYTLRVLVDETSYSANSTIEIIGDPDLRLEKRRWDDDGSFCVTADNGSRTRYGGQRGPTRFTFLWITCRSWKPWEEVIEFDVLNGTDRIAKERIPFDIKRQGHYLIRDPL